MDGDAPRPLRGTPALTPGRVALTLDDGPGPGPGEHAAAKLSRSAERTRGYLSETAGFRPPHGMMPSRTGPSSETAP